MHRRHQTISLQQASEDSPVLNRLIAQARDASERLRSIMPLIPAALRGSIQAGPMEEKTWWLLVKNNAAAAKLRQLLPTLQAHLCAEGWEIAIIRIKVQA